MASLVDFRGLQVVDPEPLTGTGGQALNDNFKYLASISNRIQCIKSTAGTIPALSPVFINGHDGTDITIELADSDNPALRPAQGLALTAITEAVTGMVAISGLVENIATDSYSVGALIYVSAAGALTATIPNEFADPIALVVRSHATLGVLKVIPASQYAGFRGLTEVSLKPLVTNAIATGVISATGPNILAQAESGTADDITDIEDIVGFCLLRADAGDTLTVKDNGSDAANKIRTFDAGDLVISSTGCVMLYRYSLTDVWRSAATSGDVTAAASITDHALVRGDGGSKGVQGTSILIDDSMNVSGFLGLTFGLPATDHTAVGPQTSAINAGETVSAFELCYLKSDGEWWRADASVVGTAAGMLAVALAAGTDTNTMLVALKGSFVRDDSWNWTVGATLYMSLTTGAITETMPSATDEVVRVIGYAVSADVIHFDPSTDYVTVV